MGKGNGVDARVVLVDSHPKMLLSLAMILDIDGIAVAAATRDLELAVRVVEDGRANVLVMDLWRRDGSFTAMISDLRLRLPNTAIVIVTMENEPAVAGAAIAAGARAYVLKDRAEFDLSAAARAAANGRPFISPGVTDAVNIA